MVGVTVTDSRSALCMDVDGFCGLLQAEQLLRPLPHGGVLGQAHQRGQELVQGVARPARHEAQPPASGWLNVLGGNVRQLLIPTL